jgi:multisubunit Na+/H+ antiporter MnhE subunit
MRFFLIWWALLSGLYMLLVFKTEPAEIVAAVICGAISATATDLVRRHGTVRLKLPGWGWLRAVATLPRQTVVDTWRLVEVLWRVVVRREDVRGRFISLPFKGARGRSPEAAGRRAVAKLVGSVAPNTLVVGFANEKERVLLHQLVATEEPPPCDPWEPGW